MSDLFLLVIKRQQRFLLLVATLFLLNVNFILAQAVDTAIVLKQINVFEAKTNEFSEGIKKLDLTKNTLLLPSSNLSDALQQNGLMYQKTYGIGSLATSALRGGAATHTSLLWNGLALGSPFNGLMDLALVPANLFNYMAVNYGGGADLWGTGAIAGSIHLGNNLELKNTKFIEARLGFGSFENYYQNLKLGFATNKQAWEFAIVNQRANNRFNYLNPFSLNETTLANATLKNTAVISNYKRLIAKKWFFKTGVWLQSTNRQIPPTFSQINSSAYQTDKNIRGYFNLFGRVRGVQVVAKAGYFFEDLYFEDEPVNIFSPNQSNKFIGEVNVMKDVGNHKFHVGLNQTIEQGKSQYYLNQVQQQIPSVFGGYKTQAYNDKLKLNANFRQSYFNQKLVPFVYGVGFSYQLAEYISIKVNHARVFRIPALNDRFWVPGGNKNLLSEQGFTHEISAVFADLNLGENVKFEHTSTLFSRNIENWIIWLPNEALWTPQNLLEVWSRGYETHSELSIHFNAVHLKTWLNTNYILSTNQIAKTPNDASVGKQLIYAPIYQGAGGISMGNNNIQIYSQAQYTGYTYTASDHSSFLTPFFTVQLGVSANLNIREQQFLISGLVQNVTNVQYQVVANRPMPPRNFQINLTYKFTKP